jgi:hypothetical protein
MVREPHDCPYIMNKKVSIASKPQRHVLTQHRWSPRIDIYAEHELRYWSERFGVPKDDIVAAVKRVGPRVEDVAWEVGLLYA